MKQNPNFVLREVYGTYLLIPVRNNVVSNDIISFNKMGATIFKEVASAENRSDILEQLNKEYNPQCDEEKSQQIEKFLNYLVEFGLIFE